MEPPSDDDVNARLVKLRTYVAELLSAAKFPVVMWSAGRDSNLLLTIARAIRNDIGVIWFQVGQDEKLAKQLMIDWDLIDRGILSYAPASVYVLGNGSDLSMVQEFSFGEARWPVVMDITPGDKCSITAFPKRSPQVLTSFDCGLVGWKASDEHWLKDGAQFPPADGTMLDQIALYAPLRDWTDAEVLEASNELGLPAGESSDVALCTACYTSDAPTCYCPAIQRDIGVQSVDWESSVTWFKQRFGLEATHA